MDSVCSTLPVVCNKSCQPGVPTLKLAYCRRESSAAAPESVSLHAGGLRHVLTGRHRGIYPQDLRKLVRVPTTCSETAPSRSSTLMRNHRSNVSSTLFEERVEKSCPSKGVGIAGDKHDERRRRHLQNLECSRVPGSRRSQCDPAG